MRSSSLSLTPVAESGPEAWGATWLLSTSPEARQRQRRSLGLSLAAQMVLTGLMLGALDYRVTVAPPPAYAEHWETTLAYEPPPPRLAPPRVAPPRPAPEPAPAAKEPTLLEPRRMASAVAPAPEAPRRVRVDPAPPPPPAPRLAPGAAGLPDGFLANTATPAPIPVLGDFGAATAGAPASVHADKVVAAGFGQPAAAASGPAAAIATGGFGQPKSAGAPAAGSIQTNQFRRETAAPAQVTAEVAPAPGVQPPRILFLPQPAYTSAAAASRIEGEVVLQVRLGADGSIAVERVVHGLGYGLDEAAEAATRQIRFTPAQRAGQAVDWTIVLHVSFRLAN